MIRIGGKVVGVDYSNGNTIIHVVVPPSSAWGRFDVVVEVPHLSHARNASATADRPKAVTTNPDGAE